ncbi:hypothetical protein Tco_1029264 [Tanacetum coccineum]|uniref:MAK10-like protein n=1 Tax=Tanacetum coccineum TaxID=301880 RepID=A0ABQ5G468_9ASTR
MGDENPIHTLGYYSKPSHKDYMNTIKLPVGNNVVPLQFDTIRAAGGKLHNKNADESWEIIKNLALYDHESWNDTKGFAKPVKAISTPQGTSKTPYRRLLELEDQINFLLNGSHLTQPTQVNKITTSCEICSVSHNTQYCMEDPEQAYVEPTFSKEFNYLLQIDPRLITLDIEGFKTYEEYKDDWIYEWNKDIPWVDEKPWTNVGVWTEATPVKHYSYIVGNSLHYQDYKWYEALKDNELKEKALRNKAIMKGLISDDESCNDGWRRWESHEITFHDHDEIDYENETYNERQELCETHELQVCNMRRFEMIKYSFGQDEEYAAVKEDKYDDLARTSDDPCRAYQEIFRIMDEGWMVTRAK